MGGGGLSEQSTGRQQVDWIRTPSTHTNTQAILGSYDGPPLTLVCCKGVSFLSWMNWKHYPVESPKKALVTNEKTALRKWREVPGTSQLASLVTMSLAKRPRKAWVNRELWVQVGDPASAYKVGNNQGMPNTDFWPQHTYANTCTHIRLCVCTHTKNKKDCQSLLYIHCTEKASSSLWLNPTMQDLCLSRWPSNLNSGEQRRQLSEQT